MSTKTQARRGGGFTLIEVLIAIVVLSIGLLGLAALQVTGLQNGQQSYQRAQASALAYDIADRMRANRAVAVTGAYSVTQSALPTAAATPDCSSVACTSTQLAAWDLANWAVRVRSTLTGGTAQIICASCTSGTVQTIIVGWSEKATDKAIASNQAYRIYVTP